MKTLLKIGGIALLLVAIVVAVGAGLAAAQNASTPSAVGNTTTNQNFGPRQAMMNNGGQGMMAQGGQGMMGNGGMMAQGGMMSNSGMMGNGGMMAHGGMGIIDRQSIIAEALGITVEELQAARAEGKTLPQLVAELGLDLEEVRAAIQAGVTEAINQAVADGTLTQEQANWMLERMELHILVHDTLDMDSIIANALGITVDELAAARAEGKRVPDLVTELGLDLATVRTDIQEGRTAAINQAVEDGILTQEQADWLLSHQGMGGRHGGQGGQGGFGRHGGNCPNGTTPPTEDTTPADNA